MIAPRFTVGDPVQVALRDARHHCRAPYYLRGKAGIVDAVLGRFRDPEQLAYHRPGLPMRYLYRVTFEQGDVWDPYDGPSGDSLQADIFEQWLEPAA